MNTPQRRRRVRSPRRRRRVGEPQTICRERRGGIRSTGNIRQKGAVSLTETAHTTGTTHPHPRRNTLRRGRRITRNPRRLPAGVNRGGTAALLPPPTASGEVRATVVVETRSLCLTEASIEIVPLRGAGKE